MTARVYHFAFSFLEQEPASAARALEERQPKEAAWFLANAPVSLCEPVLASMLPPYAADILLAAETEVRDRWLSELGTHALCAILRVLDADQQQQLLERLRSKKRAACNLLLEYRNDMVGAWVETDIPVFPLSMHADEAEKRLRARGYAEDHRLFAVNPERQLMGALSPSTLLRARGGATIGSLAQPIANRLSGRASLSAALRHPLWHTADLAPVVNTKRELIGALWYSRLRYLLSAEARHWRHGETSGDHLVTDLAQAHGESMRALMDVFVNDIK